MTSTMVRVDEVDRDAVGIVRTVAASRPLKSSATQAQGTAQEFLAGFERGGSLFGIYAGQFSMWDLLHPLLRRVGPADVDIWQYIPGTAPLGELQAALAAREIKRLRLVIDRSGLKLRSEEYYANVQKMFGPDCLRVASTHAKLVRIVGDGWNILVDGSSTLSNNYRFEQVNVRDDPALAEAVETLTDRAFASIPAPKLGEDVSDKESRRAVREMTGGVKKRGGVDWGDFVA